MFLLVCGENTTASRNYIHDLKQDYSKKNTQVFEVPASEIENVVKSEQEFTLFNEEIVYITQGLLPYWSKQKKKVTDQVAELQKNSSLKIIDWENGKSLYDLKLKNVPYAKEFKLDASLFDLQELIAPGNKTTFINTLNKLKDAQDPFIMYSMIHRHTRLLLLVKTGQPTGNIHPFVKMKAENQAKKWETDRLVKLYIGLANIDRAVKTSSTPYDIPQSLEILACYYL